MLIHQRGRTGAIGWVLHKALPPDPLPLFIWPEFVIRVMRPHLKVGKLILAALGILMATATAGFLLLQLPVLNFSVVKLLALCFESILPSIWATVAAWVVGLAVVFRLGTFVALNHGQVELNSLPATRFKPFNFVLLFALIEELVFRSGSEKWTWPQRIRASMMFGIVHIANIWVSFAMGVALGMAGFGFMLVYHWYYRKAKYQILATSAAAMTHAIYNIMVLAILAVGLVAWLIS